MNFNVKLFYEKLLNDSRIHDVQIVDNELFITVIGDHDNIYFTIGINKFSYYIMQYEEGM